MKSRIIMFAMAAVALLAVGCQKENGDGLRLIAEGYNSGTKVAVDGNTSTWVDGDMVLINGKEASVSVSGSNATVNLGEGNGVDAPFYGVYPAGIYTSNSGASYTLTLPASYTYSASAGVQHLASPMVGYTENSTSMTFKHLTAAVTVQVVNYHYDYSIVVDSIEVVSNSYKLNGEMTVSIVSDITVDPVATDDASLKSVKMLMGSGLTVAVGDSTAVQVPVLPVGDGNKFTVTVWVHRADQASIAVQLTREQTTGGSLLRANLGYARYTIGGPFSVSATKKVVFSKGNLQYQASTNTFSFASSQYSFIGSTEGNTSDTTSRKTQSYLIDLYGWATSGYNGLYAYYRYPMLETSTPANNSRFGDGTSSNLNSNYDWGRFDVVNGYPVNTWRTLLKAELEYLIGTRSQLISGLPSGTNSSIARYTKATVASKCGVLFFPDYYIHPSGLSIEGSPSYNTVGSGFSTFVVTEEDWSKMELAGVVFLPAAGYGNTWGSGTTVSQPNGGGHYWTATASSTTQAHYLNIAETALGFTTANKGFAKAVRLVRDVE